MLINLFQAGDTVSNSCGCEMCRNAGAYPVASIKHIDRDYGLVFVRGLFIPLFSQGPVAERNGHGLPYK